MRQAMAVIVALVLVLSSSGIALAGAAPAKSSKIELTCTTYGDQWLANGRAMKGVFNGEQVFGVAVQAEVEDGTTFIVAVSTRFNSDLHVLGTISMFLGQGHLRLSWNKKSDVKMPPAKDISRVVVADSREVILDGTFPAPLN